MNHFYESKNSLTTPELTSAVDAFVSSQSAPLKRVLLIPPDGTRGHSGAGLLTRLFFRRLEPQTHCDILPALGTHMVMTAEELNKHFPGVPHERFLAHNWRKDLTVPGTVPGEIMAGLSEGKLTRPVPVEINRLITEGGYDLIISIGQVVPHEVVGMANYSKNILVGCGGPSMINASHMLSVYSGFEKYLGVDFSPVRRLFDYVQENFLGKLPITYVMTVTTTRDEKTAINGLYMGRERLVFEKAVRLSQEINIFKVDPALKKCVVYLEPDVFRTAWLGNKAVYRTRNALADGAELIVLFPGFERFGEDMENDRIIRKYGYRGYKEVIKALETTPELAANLSAAAHLVMASGDGRFTIRYATLPKYRDEVLSVGYEWGDLEEYTARYQNAEDVFYIPNPALGLWKADK